MALRSLMEDQIPSYREAAQPGREFITHSPEARLAAQVLKRCIDQTDEGIGLVGVIGGDELADLQKIRVGTGSDANRQHRSIAQG